MFVHDAGAVQVGNHYAVVTGHDQHLCSLLLSGRRRGSQLKSQEKQHTQRQNDSKKCSAYMTVLCVRCTAPDL